MALSDVEEQFREDAFESVAPSYSYKESRQKFAHKLLAINKASIDDNELNS
jgi:hypothetical protein